MAAKEIDFLTQVTNGILRRQAQNIADSYSHPWDILSELLQNSVDAIELHRAQFGTEGRDTHDINIALNGSDRSITVRDTGRGFQPDKFAELLAPHGTDKSPDANIVGEKGVGLKYTIFTSNLYVIDTQSRTARIRGSIKNAALWRKGQIAERPTFLIDMWDEEDVSASQTFTEIHLADVEHVGDEGDDLFVQPIEVIEYLLRTKTAIGNLKGLFDKAELKVHITLHVKPQHGEFQEMEVPFQYMLPDSLIDSGKTVNLKEFKDRAASMDDRQKAKELSGKALVTQGSETRAGRQIHYYAFFAPTRPLYADMSKKNGLLVGSGQEAQPLYEGGIYVTTKGRPTGVELDPPSTGYAGYWPNIYMVLNDDGIVFDVGRKAVPGRTRGMLKEIARGIFNSFFPYVTYSTTDPPAVAGTSATIQQYSKQQKFEEITQLPNLGLPQISYLKHPDGQEAAVVALFHELVGAGLLKGYRTLKTGLKETYDLWGRYQIDVSDIGVNKRQLAGTKDRFDLPIVIEFKYAAQSILADFQRDVKFFQDIDLIVCWDLAETSFARYEVKVEPLSADDVLFFASNYLLTWPGAYNLGAASEKPVLALRKFMEDLRTQT